MKRLLNDIMGLLGPLVFLSSIGCHTSGISLEEKKEFREVERALDAISSAPQRDRGVRIEELKNTSCKTERISVLKKNCLASYLAFDNATRLLAEAREKTAKTEAAVARIRENKKAGLTIGRDQETAIKKLSQTTTLSLEAVNMALDKAESLVQKCETERKVLEALASPN